MSSDYIVYTFKQKIKETGVTYAFVAQKTEIDYQRLIRIFNNLATMSAIELLKLCEALNISADMFRHQSTA